MDNLIHLLNKKRKTPILINELSTSTASSFNKDDEKKEIYLKNKSSDMLFKNNPNIIYREKITDNNDSLGFNDLFEIFTSIKGNITYIVSPNKNKFCLDIYSLHDKKLTKSLKGHNNHITMVKYFSDYLNKEYLISADINGIIIIWEINRINDDIKKYEIKIKIKNFIYSCIMFFDIFNYIITSSCGNENTKLFIMDDNNNIKLVHNLKESENNIVYFLQIWFNQKDKEYYLIQFCKKKIVINTIFRNNIYWKLIVDKNMDSCYMNGFIDENTNNEYLYACSMNGFIYICDLYKKILINSLFINNNFLSQIIQWNKKYIIITNGNKNNILVFDIESGNIISKIFSKHEKGIMNIKKVIHPFYGESLISCGLEGSIFIWTVTQPQSPFNKYI